MTCLGTGTRQKQLENVSRSPGRRQSWTRLDNDGSDHRRQYILDTISDYGPCRMGRSCHCSWERNLEVGMQRPLPGALQTLPPVTGVLWLLRVYLSSFWQYVQNDCTENTLDLLYVEVTEVDWILESGVVSSGPVVGRTQLSAERMAFLGSLVPLLVFLQEPSVYTGS